MRALLYITALLSLSYGLWVHDWSMISAGVALLVLWPLIGDDVEMREERRRRELLERLWDDDDLSDSA